MRKYIYNIYKFICTYTYICFQLCLGYLINSSSEYQKVLEI